MLVATALLLQAAPAAAQRASAVTARGVAPAAIEAARRFLCPNGGTPQRALVGRRGGRCAPGSGGWGGGAGGGGDDAVPGWDLGLPAPSRAQAPCPPGTVPAVSAQAGAVRCVPG